MKNISLRVIVEELALTLKIHEKNKKNMKKLSEAEQLADSFLRLMMDSGCSASYKSVRLENGGRAEPKKIRGFNLVKRANRKLGFVYYVRYWHEGKMLASKWCTHTNEYEKACDFAVQNREKIISAYLSKIGGEVERFFGGFYNPDNPVFQSECSRNGAMSESKRQQYHSTIKNDFLPFLRKKRIGSFAEISVPLLVDFQDVLLAKGIKATSVNDSMTALSRVFKYLTRKGLIADNPYLNLPRVPIKPEEKRTHGCFELEKMQGVFNHSWNNKTAYLLNLIIYTTDMRNSEIKRIRKKDIIDISGYRFIDIKDSKTENGIRLVPLHEAVYGKIMDYAKDFDDETYIFAGISRYQFQKATMELAKILVVDEAYLKKNNITFYSGRHFWKTLMNSGGLGEDAEEIFMGHTVSSNVAKLYNHRDKQGKELFAKKAREVFDILDAGLFCAAPTCPPPEIHLQEVRQEHAPSVPTDPKKDPYFVTPYPVMT